MQTRKITIKQSDGTDYVSFFLQEMAGKEISTKQNELQKIGVLLKSLNIPAKEIFLIQMNKVPGALGATYNLHLQCDKYISVYNKVAIPLTHTAATLSNTFRKMISSATDQNRPLFTFQIENVEFRDLKNIDIELAKALFSTPSVDSVSYRPTRDVSEVEAFGERALPKDKVGEALGSTVGDEFFAKQGDASMLFDKIRLGRLPYYLTILQRLLNIETKVLVDDNVKAKKADYDRQIETLNRYANNTDASKEAAGLSDNNIWANFKRQVHTQVKTITQLKNQLNLQADLQALFDVLDKRIRASTFKAVMDARLIRLIKDNFIRSLQYTATAYWAELQRNTAINPSDAAALEKFLEIFGADIVTEDSVQYLAFASTYGKKSLSAIADDINLLPPSVLRSKLIEKFKKENDPERVIFTMENAVEKTKFRWSQYVTDANNPVLLAKEEAAVEALVNDFYESCQKKLADSSTRDGNQAAASTYTQVTKVLPRIKDLFEEIKESSKELTAQITEYNSAISKLQKPVTEQQRVSLGLFLDLYKPNAILTELKNIAFKAQASKDALIDFQNRIGKATTIPEAERLSVAAKAKLEEAKQLKTAFDAKKQEIDKALIECDKQIHNKRIDDLMRENFLRIRVALFDKNFLKENTTQFLCMGGKTVSLPDGEAIKVPHGVAEMIEKMLKCNKENIAEISLTEIMDTLTAAKKFAQAAQTRHDARVFKFVRKDPMQKFYEIVAALDLNFVALSALSADKLTAINLKPANATWPAEFENQWYKLELLKKQQFDKRPKRNNNIASVTQVEVSQNSSLSSISEGSESFSSRRRRGSRAAV
jgi:hypothetical protein